jgi:hypothetical protein
VTDRDGETDDETDDPDDESEDDGFPSPRQHPGPTQPSPPVENPANPPPAPRPVRIDDLPDVDLPDAPLWAFKHQDDPVAVAGIAAAFQAAAGHLSSPLNGGLAEVQRRVTESLTVGPESWVAQWGGQGLGNRVVDLSALLEIVQPYANAVRWYARSLFEGGRTIDLPGARAIAPGSLIVVLGPNLHEKPLEMGGQSLWPSVEAGRLLTATMAASNDQDLLTGLFRPLSKNAAKAYVSTLEIIVARKMSVTTYIELGERPREVKLLLEQARDDLKWLLEPVSTASYEETRLGTFRAVDDRNEGHFALETEDDKGQPGDTVAGVISSDLRHTPLTTRSRVEATIRVTEAVESWRPRAPRTRRLLLSFKAAPRRER